MGSTYTPGFVVAVRANGTLQARVQFFSEAAQTTPFDFTGYGAFWGTIKERLTDTDPLVSLFVDVSFISGADGATTTAADGWLVLYASADDTAALQPITEGLTAGRKRGFVDVFGNDSQGNRVPIGHGFCDMLPSVTETFA